MNKIVLLWLDTVWKDFFDEYAPQLVDRTDIAYGGCRVASSWSASTYILVLIWQLTSRHGAHKYQRNFSVVGRTEGSPGGIINDQSFCANTNSWSVILLRFNNLFNQFPDLFFNQLLPEDTDDSTANQIRDVGQL